MHAGSLSAEDAPVFAAVFLGLCYLGVGVMAVFRRRWLLIAVITGNALAVVGFFVAYASKPDVITSIPGLMAKTSQVLLEIGLVYLLLALLRAKRNWVV